MGPCCPLFFANRRGGGGAKCTISRFLSHGGLVVQMGRMFLFRIDNPSNQGAVPFYVFYATREFRGTLG